MWVKDFAHCLKEAFGFSRHIALHILGDPCALENLDEYLNIARKIGLELNKTPKLTLLLRVRFLANIPLICFCPRLSFSYLFR